MHPSTDRRIGIIHDSAKLSPAPCRGKALEGKAPLYVELIKACQEEVRAAWDYRQPRPFIMGKQDQEEILGADSKPSIKGSLVVTADGLQVVASDICNYMRLAVSHDSVRGKLHICRNPKCETPYFREARAGQVFCSHTCAVAVSVARFQERKKAKTKAKKGGSK